MKTFITLLIFLMHICVWGQNDCPDAITVCGDMNYIGLSAEGIGDIQEIGPNACSLGSSGDNENNTIWLRILIKNGGTLGFILTPETEDLVIDFDFWLFGPGSECNALGTALRCSTTNPGNANLDYNTTGMNDTEEDTSEGPGADGNAFVQWITVEDDDVLYLVVDRPHGFGNFSMEWTGTATFHEVPYFNNPDNVSLDLNLCDQDGVSNGFTEVNLTNHGEMLIGPQTHVQLTYYTDNNGAITGQDPITNPSEYTNISNPQTIYMRMTNTVTGCIAVETFEINVYTIPVLNNPQNIPLDIFLCDPETEGNLFDLTIYETMFTGSQANVDFSYYENEEDIEDGPAIATPAMYEPPANPQTIYVKAANPLYTECYSTLSFTIEIPVMAGEPEDISLCDTDENGFREFDLSSNDENILNGATGGTVIYYASELNAINEVNPIGPLYQNTMPYINQTIWARMEIIGEECYDLVTFVISVTPLPAINAPGNTPPTIQLCDEDGVNDQSTEFDLTVNESMMAGAQTNLEFNYYESMEDLEAENPITNKTAYINTSNPQTIYLKIHSTATDCDIIRPFTIETRIIIAGEPQDLALCDTNENGWQQFNLATNDVAIRNGNPTAVITYYTSEENAENEFNPIGPLYQNQVPYAGETIWARAELPNTICYDITSFTISILNIPVFNNPQNIDLDQSQCDNDTLDDQSDTFDLTIHETMFTGTQTDIEFAYYASLADFEAGNAIVNPGAYANISNPQTIYVQITNTVTECVSNPISFEIEIINPVSAGPPMDLELCDTRENGLQVFNLWQNDDLIINGQPNRDVTYYASYEDAYNETNPLNTVYQNHIPYATQIIWARIESTDGCFGYAITSFTISILEMPDINYEVEVVDFTNFDNSISIVMSDWENYEFSMDGITYTDVPYFDNLVPGLYNIYIRSKDHCKTISDEVVVLNYPKFFTPNGDGINETWQVFYLYYLPHSKVYIYDRYGKLVSNFWGDNIGWDGMYNGHPLPSTDYWFLLELESGRIIKGHFAMIR